VNDRREVIQRAADAYRTLADLAETVEDEWQYVTDLVDAYLPAILAMAGAGDGREPAVVQIEAVDEAIAEIELITDPHKAIDWLSTFPHVVALALGGDVDSTAADPGASDAGAVTDSDDDSPFRMLGRPR
jgi:hypothetical protein